MGEMTDREQRVVLAVMAGCRNTVAIADYIRGNGGPITLTQEVLAALKALDARGLVDLQKVGRYYVAMAPTLDDLHVMAIGLSPDPVKTTPAGSTWVNIDNRGSLRCRETGVIVQAIAGGRWEVLRPEWDPDRSGRVMRMVHIDLHKIEALGHAGRIRPLLRTRIALDWEAALNVEAARRTVARLNGEPEPLIGSDTVPGFRGGKIPPGWAPEHSAKLAVEARAQAAGVGPGSLVAAAEIVDRVVKRARYDALRAVKAEIEEWRDRFQEPDDKAFRAYADVFGYLLADAARKLGVRWP